MKVYIKETQWTIKRNIIRVRVETTQLPPRRAKLKIVYNGGELVVEGSLTSGYRSRKGFVAYYNLYAKYHNVVQNIMDKIKSIELLKE